MNIIFNSQYKVFSEVFECGTTCNIIEEAFVIIDSEGLEITHLNAVEGVSYSATPRVDYVDVRAQKEEIVQSLELAKLFEGTTEGDADILALKQQYSDMCNGVPIVTKS